MKPHKGTDGQESGPNSILVERSSGSGAPSSPAVQTQLHPVSPALNQGQPMTMLQSPTDINIIVQQLLSKLRTVELENKQLLEKNANLEMQLGCLKVSHQPSNSMIQRSKSDPNSQPKKASQPQFFIFPDTSGKCSIKDNAGTCCANVKTNYNSSRSEADGAEYFEEKHEVGPSQYMVAGVSEIYFTSMANELAKTKKQLHELQTQKVLVLTIV